MSGDANESALQDESNTSESKLEPATVTNKQANECRKWLVRQWKKGTKTQRQRARRIARCKKGKRCGLTECPICEMRTRRKAIKKEIEPVDAIENQRVRVKDVLVLPSHQEIDFDLACVIAESIKVHSQIHPIAVRRVREQEDGQEVAKTVLVAGAHRLRAAKLIDMKYIDCRYLEGDETDAKLIEIGENLWRKNLTALQYAEQLAEWVTLAERKVDFSGRDVQKLKRGRPPGGIARAARELPAIGRSVEARRKSFERARKIAKIAPAAKEAVKAAGLDNNQKALLQIAEASGRKAQVKKAKKLAQDMRKPTEPVKVKSPPLQPDSDGKGTDASADTEGADVERPDDTTFEALEALWKIEGRKLWAYTPFAVRNEFIEKLRRAHCRAKADIFGFITEVFQGRKEVKTQELYCFARAKSLKKKDVRRGLKHLCYHQTKHRDAAAPRYYRNKNHEWASQHKMISDAELSAPLVAEMKQDELAQRDYDRDHKPDPIDDDYFKI